MGNEVDLQTPHRLGKTVTVNGMRADVVELLPASMKTADMTPDNPGICVYHRDVRNHIEAGIMATYTVLP